MSIPGYDDWKTGGLSAGTYEPKTIEWCKHCNQPITDCDEYWIFDGETVHDDCLIEWLENQPFVERIGRC